VPHVNIKHFPRALGAEQEAAFLVAVTKAVQETFGCEERVISIALESVAPEQWNEKVYVPEIVNRRSLLRKLPGY
jgi:phenylpyruvate tautomerase PptA (4-oxalocrotonate tautomerase family)